MGLYPNSTIHNRYSDFHVEECCGGSGRCKCTDIDRLWVEERKRKIVMVMDLKYLGSEYDKKLTETEEIVSRFFESNNIPFVIVYIRDDFLMFRVWHPESGYNKELTKDEYAQNFIGNLEHEAAVMKKLVKEKEVKKNEELRKSI